MKNMQKRAERREMEKARKAEKLPEGTQVEMSDRVYVVDSGGSYRVDYYK